MELAVRPATHTDLAEIQEWSKADASPGEYIGAYSPQAAITNPDSPEDGWVGLDGDELVAYASFTETPEHHALIGFIVKPSRRREGIAKTFVPALLARKELTAFSKVIGTPQLDNIAALKILERAGFHRAGYDEDGLVVFERR